MIKLNQAVIVEGKYDKIKLSSIIDACIIETCGFNIFSDTEKISLIKTLADKCGVIIMTDSDFAGFKIRNFLNNILCGKKVYNAYLPDIKGKEKRKRITSKEGLIGVEGFGKQDIISSLEKSGALSENAYENRKNIITKSDIFLAGLSGSPNSSKKRKELLEHLSLPTHISPNALPKILSDIITKEEFFKLSETLFKD